MEEPKDKLTSIERASKKYFSSPAGKQAIRKYQNSPAGKKVREKYLNSEKGKQASLKYYLSAKGQKARAQREQKRKFMLECQSGSLITLGRLQKIS